MNLLISGWTWNSRKALKSTTTAKRAPSQGPGAGGEVGSDFMKGSLPTGAPIAKRAPAESEGTRPRPRAAGILVLSSVVSAGRSAEHSRQVTGVTMANEPLP